MRMSATSALENNEELENVPLVRMEDVQPDRSVEVLNLPQRVVDEIDDSCVINEDDDSNIGSMVLIKSEDVVIWQDNSNSSELILPDEDPLRFHEGKSKAKESDSWPTLEILPGGVIKNADKYEYDLTSSCHSLIDGNKGGLGMYVCAKCSESFDKLLLLIKHVRCHEQKRKKEIDINKQKSQGNKEISRKSKRKFIIELKNKCKKPKES